MEVPLARAERSTSSMARPIHLERRNVVSVVQLVAAVDMMLLIDGRCFKYYLCVFMRLSGCNLGAITTSKRNCEV